MLVRDLDLLYTGNNTFSHSQCEHGIMQCVCMIKLHLGALGEGHVPE